MKKVTLTALLFAFCFSVSAQDGAKLDTLLKVTRDIQKDVKSQVQSNLGNRKFGVEVNPFYLLMVGEETLIQRGGFSYFGLRESTELAFPVHFMRADENYSEAFADIHWREYFSGVKRGFYYEALARVAWYRGRDEKYHYNPETGEDWRTFEPWQSGVRFGIGFGIGYRFFAKNGLYWGTSWALGRFLTPEAKVMGNTMWLPTQTAKYFSYAELFKIGKAF